MAAMEGRAFEVSAHLVLPELWASAVLVVRESSELVDLAEPGLRESEAVPISPLRKSTRMRN